MAVVPVILRILAEKGPGVASALTGVRADFKGLADLVDTVKLKAAAFTAAATIGLFSLGASVVHTAGEFQQLEAKLQSVSKTSEQASANFQNAVKIAAASPFDVKGVVAATVSLEAFGQRSQQLLPLVGNLSAAFGKSIQEGALTLGKAFSGSLEGFESLRNTYGISTLELGKFGAVMAKTGAVSVATATDLSKARQALTQIIQTRYGDAMERQSKTLFGAFSNAQDAVDRLFNALGKDLIPLITFGTRTVTGFIEAFEGMPAPLRTLIVVSGVAATGLTALSTAALGFFTLAGSAIGPLTSLARVLGLTATAASALAGPTTVTVLGMGAMATSAAQAATTVTVYGRAVGVTVATQTVFNAELVLTGQTVLGLLQVFPALTAEVLALRVATGGVGGSVSQLALSAGQAAAPIQLLGQRIGVVPALAGPASTALATLGQSTSGAAGRLAGFMSIPFTPALLAIGAAAGVAFTALNRMNTQTEELDKSVRDQATALHDTYTGLRQMRDILIDVTGGQARFKTATGDVVVVMRELVAELANVKPADVFSRFAQSGISLEDFGKSVEDSRARIKRYEDALAELAKQQKDYEATIRIDAPGQGNDEDLGRELRYETAKVGLEAVLERQKSLRDEIAKTNATVEAGDKLLPNLKSTAKAYDDASTSAGKFQNYLTSVGKTDSIPQLARALDLTNQKLADMRAGLAGTQLPLNNLAALQERLLTAGPEEAATIQAILKLEEARLDINKKIETSKDNQIKEQIRQADLAIERENLDKGEDLSRERNRVAAELALVKAGSEEELQIRKRVATLDGRIQSERVQTARNAFDQEQLALREDLDQLKGTGEATAEEIAQAIERVIVMTEAWQAANRKVLSESPELSKTVGQSLRGLRNDLDTATRAIPKEKLDQALATASAFATEAITAEQKLAAAQSALTTLRNLQDSGSITTTRERTKLQQEINKLTSEELKLKQEVTKEERAQARETSSLKRDNLQSELDLLRARQTLSGKDESTAILEKEQQILSERIQAIRDQEQAEVDAGATAERAHENAELRITQIKNEETLKRIQKDQEATKSVEDEAKRQQDILERFRQSRVGGASSPLKGLSEVSYDLSSLGLGDFNLGSFGSGFGPKSGRAPSNLVDFQAKVDRDIRAGDRAAGRGPTNPYTDAINEQERAARGSRGVEGPVNNYYLTLQNQTLDIRDPKSKEAVRHLVDEYAQEGSHRGVAS